MTIDVDLATAAWSVGLFAAGWLANVFATARDKSIVSLQEDETIIKKPNEGFVLIQVTPDVARKVIQKYGELDGNKYEARSLYDRYNRAMMTAKDAERKTTKHSDLD